MKLSEIQCPHCRQTGNLAFTETARGHSGITHSVEIQQRGIAYEVDWERNDACEQIGESEYPIELDTLLCSTIRCRFRLPGAGKALTESPDPQKLLIRMLEEELEKTSTHQAIQNHTERT